MVRAARRRQVLAFALVVVGVVLALVNTNAQAELDRRREASCDGSLLLPTTAFGYGGAGLLVGLAALLLMARWFRRSRQAIAFILLATALAAVTFETFALVTAVQHAQPDETVCAG